MLMSCHYYLLKPLIILPLEFIIAPARIVKKKINSHFCIERYRKQLKQHNTMVTEQKRDYESPSAVLLQMSAELNFCQSENMDVGLETIIEDSYTWIF